jgi:uncharacterized membrane protein
MRVTTAHLLRVFIAGLLAALPLAATLFIIWWAVSILIRFLGPDSAIGSLFMQVGLGVGGSELAGYLLGVLLVLAAIFGLGLLVEAGLQRGMVAMLESVMSRIPVVRTIYDLAQKMVGLFSKGEGDGVRSMSPVWCRFGGPGGAMALALLSSPQPVRIGDASYVAILVPTAPVPVGGGLIFVPEAWVTPAEIGIEGLTSLYVSMGVTASHHLPKALPASESKLQPASKDA